MSPCDPQRAARQCKFATESQQFRVLRGQILRIGDVHRVVDVRIGVELVTPYAPRSGVNSRMTHTGFETRACRHSANAAAIRLTTMPAPPSIIDANRPEIST